MSQALNKIKTRIKSVSGAYKVTSAMKLVSTIKLKTWKNKMLGNKEYQSSLNDVVDELLMCSEKIDSPFIKINETNNNKLYIIVSSTLGLCGSYNQNIFKVGDKVIKENDVAIVLGGKGIAHYIDGKFEVLNGFEHYGGSQDAGTIKKLSNLVISEFEKGKYGEVHIIYSEYKNSLSFIPKDYCLLPITKKTEEKLGYPPIMEPSQKELINTLIPLYVKGEIYSKLLESSVCEEASRSNAMENATNNAKDILDELNIEFNKTRQGAITQEIIEIVSASKAV